ncbi:hypothetical protein HDV64DRAFT_199415 [Trichoderma sp. TUCIM 5745]
MFYCQSVELHCFAPSSFVSPYSDSSIAVLEGAVLIGMISCIIRSFFKVEARGHAALYILFIISRGRRKKLTHSLALLPIWNSRSYGWDADKLYKFSAIYILLRTIGDPMKCPIRQFIKSNKGLTSKYSQNLQSSSLNGEYTSSNPKLAGDIQAYHETLRVISLVPTRDGPVIRMH